MAARWASRRGQWTRRSGSTRGEEASLTRTERGKGAGQGGREGDVAVVGVAEVRVDSAL